MSGPDRESMYTNSDSYEAFTTSTATRKTSKIDDYNSGFSGYALVAKELAP